MQLLYSLRHHEKPVSAVRFHPEDANLLASCDANFVFQFDLRTRRPCAKIDVTEFTKRENLFTFQWFGNDLLVQDRLGFVTRLNHLKSLEPETLISTRCSTFFKNQILQNGALLTGGQEQDQICIWNLEETSSVFDLQLNLPNASRGMLMGAEELSTGMLAVCSEGGYVDFVEASGERVGFFHLPGETFTGLIMNQSGNAGVCTTPSNQIHSFTADFDTNSFDLYRSLKLDCEGSSTPMMRHDNRIFALIGWDRCIRLFHWKKLKLIYKIPSKYVVNDFHFQPGSDRFAFATEQGSISVYEYAR